MSEPRDRRELDQMLGQAISEILCFRCPRCKHLAGYRTSRETVKCWWPECGYESDGSDFEERGS